MPQDSQSQNSSKRAVSSPVQPCPTHHWIVVRLIRLPDKKQRDSWWPIRRHEAYASESFSAEITDGHKDGKLDGNGSVSYDNIPAGSCQFLFNQFYDEIDQFFKKELR